MSPEPPPPPPMEFVPPPPVAEASLPLNFRNPLAVRVALLVALLATLFTIPTLRLAPFPFLNWLAAGFFAVWIYKRKTGSLVNVRAGVRLGWLTGILMSAVWSLLFVIQLAFVDIRGTIEQQFQQLPKQDPVVAQQMQEMLHSGPALAAIILFVLGLLFCLMTALSVAGGALGAKMIGRD